MTSLLQMRPTKHEASPDTASVVRLNLANIQGNVLRGYTHPSVAYLLVHFRQRDGGREWMAGLIPEVTTALPWPDGRKPATTLNVMLTFAGLGALGLDTRSLESFPKEFKQGMAARAELLGDQGATHPRRWEAGYGKGEIHAALCVYALVSSELDERLAELRHCGEAMGVAVVAEQRAYRHPNGAEHFGYADGLGQPSVDGSGVAAQPGQGAYIKGGGWRPIRAGEFLLGYPDEEHQLASAPRPSILAKDGTYVVYRKLHENVALFRQLIEQWGRRYPGGPEAIAAKLAGRWRDGTPLAVSPHAPNSQIVEDEQRRDAFTFGDDPAGTRCPVGAHIRRANPRDGLPFDGALVNRHRMIRRGVAYGERFPVDGVDDGQDRGLLFVCFQASIDRQFEFVQAHWLNDGNVFGVASDKDPVGGTTTAAE